MKSPRHFDLLIIISLALLPGLAHLHLPSPPLSSPNIQLVLLPQMPSDAPQLKSSLKIIQNLPNLTGALTLLPNISLFYDYLRDVGSADQRTMDPNQQTTIFAPLNAAIMRLKRKPHQGLQVSSSEPSYHDLSASAQIAREESNLAYLARWVSTHLVSQAIHPDQFPSSTESSPFQFKNINDRSFEITCNQAESGQERWHGCKIQPGNIQIVGFTSASNGVVYIIDETIPLDSDEASGDLSKNN